MIIDKLSQLADDVRIWRRHLVNQRLRVFRGFEEGVTGICWDQSDIRSECRGGLWGALSSEAILRIVQCCCGPPIPSQRGLPSLRSRCGSPSYPVRRLPFEDLIW